MLRSVRTWSFLKAAMSTATAASAASLETSSTKPVLTFVTGNPKKLEEVSRICCFVHVPSHLIHIGSHLASLSADIANIENYVGKIFNVFLSSLNWGSRYTQHHGTLIDCGGMCAPLPHSSFRPLGNCIVVSRPISSSKGMRVGGMEMTTITYYALSAHAHIVLRHR